MLFPIYTSQSCEFPKRREKESRRKDAEGAFLERSSALKNEEGLLKKAENYLFVG